MWHDNAFYGDISLFFKSHEICWEMGEWKEGGENR